MVSTQVRRVRRVMGAFAAGLKRIGLGQVDDPRLQDQVKRPLASVLAVVLLALATRQHSLKDMERQSTLLSRKMRKALKVFGRVPDTTVRTLMMRLDHDSLRGLLFRQVRSAHRSKQLEPQVLPFGMCAIDGKYSATKKPQGPYAQDLKGAHELRTMTVSLISAAAPVVLDAMPVPAKTNEMGIFPKVLETLRREYGRSALFRLISADAGMTSRENARLVVAHGWDYLFALKDGQPTLRSEAERLIGPRLSLPAMANTEDVTDNQTSELREIWVSKEIAGYHEWAHLRTVIRVRHTTLKNGMPVKPGEDRYFLSSLGMEELSPAMLLHGVRAHWRIENEVHGALDIFYDEDKQPWIYATPGQLSINILRRVMLNITLLHRHGRRKRESTKMVPWKTLIATLTAGLHGATSQHLDGLRWPNLPPARVPCRPG